MTDRLKACDLVEEFILCGYSHEAIVKHLIINFLPGDVALQGMQSLMEEYHLYDIEEDEEDEEDDEDYVSSLLYGVDNKQ